MNAPLIRDASGRFYAGMTLQQAKLDGTDKSRWRRDFSDIDKNKDGVLSVDEIIKERDKIASRNNWSALGWGALGAFDLVHSLKTGGSTFGKIFWLGLDALFMFSHLNRASNINKGTAECKQLLMNQNVDYNV